MDNRIDISKNKVLKLTNVIIQEISMNDEENFNSIVLQMENFIKSKGALPIGPFIQKISYSIDDNGEVDLKMFIMRQSDKSIYDVNSPYMFEGVIRVRNCMYAHYIGPYESIKLANDKINIVAFEENLILSNESYTIFVNQNDDYIVADVFVEIKTNE